MYGLAGIYTFQVHCLFTACTIHIINLPTIAATNYFVQACNILQELIPRNDWAKSSIIILRSLVERWELILPQDAEEALYRDFDEGGDKSTSASEQGHHSEPGGLANSYGGRLRRQSIHRTGSAATQSTTSNRYDDPQSASTTSPGGPTHWPPLRNPASPTDNGMPMIKRPHFPPLGMHRSSSTATASSPGSQNANSYLYVPQGSQPLLVPVDVTGEEGIDKTLRSRREAEIEDLGGLENSVEGLKFGDDWRDPFVLGYLGPQR